MTVYWVNTFTSIRDRERLQRYADLAGPAIRGAGGRFIARGAPLAILEGDGQPEELRTTLIEFADLDAALAAYRSEGYQHALEALGDAATRDIRIVAAVEES